MSSKYKIKRIEPEKVETPEMNRPDYDYGYKDRPLNIKRAWYNTYLDSISITATSSTGLTPTFTLEDWTITKVWDYKRTLDWWKIYFPVTWTYIIDAAIHESAWNTATELMIDIDDSSSATLLWIPSVTSWLNPALRWSWVLTINITKWDYIEVSWDTDAAWWIMALDITITKIS